MKIYLTHNSEDKAEVLSISGRFRLIPIPADELLGQNLPSACVSGGEISEYLRNLSKKGAERIFIPRIIRRFSMPAENGSGKPFSAKELAALLYRYAAKPFYSPQMAVNYFIFPDESGTPQYILFDNAHSVSEKIRLVKKLGISEIFLSYHDISDIIGDIIF